MDLVYFYWKWIFIFSTMTCLLVQWYLSTCHSYMLELMTSAQTNEERWSIFSLWVSVVTHTNCSKCYVSQASASCAETFFSHQNMTSPGLDEFWSWSVLRHVCVASFCIAYKADIETMYHRNSLVIYGTKLNVLFDSH